MSNKKGKSFHVWIISGPSGSGKTTLCEALLRDKVFGPTLMKSVSYTTRAPRPGEVRDKDYCFISKKKFLELKARNVFLENEKIFETYYGTPKSCVQKARGLGRDLLLAIDVKGAATVRRFFKKEASSIFIMPPDFKELVRRLKGRSSETKKDIEKRLRRVKIENLCAKQYDYIVVNDDLNEALNQLKSILTAKGCEVDNVLRSA